MSFPSWFGSRGRLRERSGIGKAYHADKTLRSILATWRLRGSLARDAVEVQRGARGEDEPVARLVDQPESTEPRQGVVRVFWADVVVGAVADKLIDRPGALIVGVEETVQNTPIVAVVGFFDSVRLLYGDGILCVGVAGL